MRELKTEELLCVAGGKGQCTPANSYGGVTNPNTVANDIIGIYEGLVAAASHVIERVANALGN